MRITGSVQDEKSVNAPTDASLSSVGRRRRGNRAKRMSGTDSRAPTQNPPTASNAPRKERLLFGETPNPKVPQSGFLNILHHQPCHLQVPAATMHAHFTFALAVPGGMLPISLHRLA